jgi:hypothetical protein
VPCKNILNRLKVVDCPPIAEIVLGLLIGNGILVEYVSKLGFCLLDHPVRKTTGVFFNQYQMLEIVMRVKQ